MIKKGSKTYVTISIVSWILLIAYITTVISTFTILFLVGICDYTNLDYLNASFNSYERDKNLVVNTFDENFYLMNEKINYEDLNVNYIKLDCGAYFNNKLYIATHNEVKNNFFDSNYTLYIYECDLIKKESKIIHVEENVICGLLISMSSETSLFFNYDIIDTNGSKLNTIFEFDLKTFDYKIVAQGKNLDINEFKKKNIILNTQKILLQYQILK